MGKSWRDQDEEEILGGRSGLKVIRSGGGDGTWKSKQFYLARTRGEGADRRLESLDGPGPGDLECQA